MKALIRWIQLGNVLSKTYKENQSTDAYTVGGLALAPAVAAIMTAIAWANPDLNITPELIATAAAMVGGTASQVLPVIMHWFQQRGEAAGVSVAPTFEEAILPVEFWAKDGQKHRPVGEHCKTLGAALDFGAKIVWVNDGRIWTATEGWDK